MTALRPLPSLKHPRKRNTETILRPTPSFFKKHRIYSNQTGENFVVQGRKRFSAAKPLTPDRYEVDVCELNSEKENVRYRAQIFLYRQSIYLSSFVQVCWGEATDKSAFTKHYPTRLILDYSIMLAQKYGLSRIYAQPNGVRESSQLFALGFTDPNPLSSWMVLDFESKEPKDTSLLI